MMAPAGWTPIVRVIAGDQVQLASFWHAASSNDPTSWTFTLGAGQAAIAIVGYSGVDPNAPIDTAATAADSVAGTSHTAPSVTMVAANELVLGVYGLKAASTSTPPAGSTERVDVSSSGSGSVSNETTDFSFVGPGATGAKTNTSSVSARAAMQTIALRQAPGAPGAVTATEHYSAGATLDASNNVIERTLSLPGGVAITKRAGGTGDVWSYPNLHGDVSATCDSAGVKQGNTFTYDPYGNALAGLPDNSDGNIDTGWTGQRPLEHEASLLPIIEMGARPYSPTLGRFLQVDPILNGNTSAFTYPGDPVNSSDIDGRCPWCYALGLGELGLLLRYLDSLTPGGNYFEMPVPGNSALEQVGQYIKPALSPANQAWWQLPGSDANRAIRVMRTCEATSVLPCDTVLMPDLRHQTPTVPDNDARKMLLAMGLVADPTRGNGIVGRFALAFARIVTDGAACAVGGIAGFDIALTPGAITGCVAGIGEAEFNGPKFP